MAFAVFLEYFPELKNGARFLVAGTHSMFSFGNQGPQYNGPSSPYISPDELQTAKLQFDHTKETIENLRREPTPYYYGIAHRLNIPRELVQAISHMLDEAIEWAHHDSTTSSQHCNP